MHNIKQKRNNKITSSFVNQRKACQNWKSELNASTWNFFNHDKKKIHCMKVLLKLGIEWVRKYNLICYDIYYWVSFLYLLWKAILYCNYIKNMLAFLFSCFFISFKLLYFFFAIKNSKFSDIVWNFFFFMNHEIYIHVYRSDFK